MRCRCTNGSRTSSRGFSLATVVETGAVELEIKTETGGGDHLHVEISETDAGRGADALEAATNDRTR
jgi:hypothetical protein